MAELLLVPEVAAGATEVVISEWLAEPGAVIKAGDPLAVIETDKAIVEVEAESGGTLLRTLAESGSRIGVGRPMALVGEAAELGGDLDATLASLGYEAGPAPGAPPERRDDGEVREVPEVEHPAKPRQFISPVARKLLREAGIVPETLTGTGPQGRIRRRDVEEAIRAQELPGADASTAPSEPSDRTTDRAPATRAPGNEIPHTRVRRAIARRLTESKQYVPHFYVKRSVRIDDLLDLRARLNQAAGCRISVNDFLIRGVAVAHQRVPDANVIWTDEVMRQFDTVDIAVAVASERGLVAPVLRGVEQLSLSAISSQVRSFVEKAHTGKLQQADLEGGSISISNLGMYGVEQFSAIINPPQSAILAVGAGRPLPVAVDGKVEVRTVIDLVLSVDHRAIDGALAAQWLAALVDALENPLALAV